jgi:hypothetical protein
MMTLQKKPAKLYLLFFTAYLLFSIVVVVYDYHDPAQSASCSLCSMRTSLSSTIGQAALVPPVDDHPSWARPLEGAVPLRKTTRTSNLSYRGPPDPTSVS